MSLHLSAAGVQEYGAMALMSLIAAHDRNMQEVTSTGALSQVLKSMRAQRENPSVLDACVRMLLNLVLKKGEVYGGAICREGGVLVLMDALKAHPEDANLQSRCQSLLKKIDSSGVQQRQGEWIMAELSTERQRLTELMKELLMEQKRFFENQGGTTEDTRRGYRRINAAATRFGPSPPRGSRSPPRSPPVNTLVEASYDQGGGFDLEQLQAFNSRISHARSLRSQPATRSSYLR